jgi:hypothetical protein
MIRKPLRSAPARGGNQPERVARNVDAATFLVNLAVTEKGTIVVSDRLSEVSAVESICKYLITHQLNQTGNRCHSF